MSESQYERRHVEERDIPHLIMLDDSCARSGNPRSRTLSDFRRLLAKPDACDIVAEKNGHVVGYLSSLLDKKQKIAKLLRVVTEDPDVAVFLLQAYLQDLGTQGIGVAYATSRTMGHDGEKLLVAHGFCPAGILAGSGPFDNVTLNGLFIWYAPEILTRERDNDIEVHPLILPLAKMCAEKFKFNNPKEDLNYEPQTAFSEPEHLSLEFVDAAMQAETQFCKLQERNLLSSAFYPFHAPNSVISNASRTVEIFARLIKPQRLLNIVAEHVVAPVDPLSLYESIARIAYGKGVSFIEAINDASDTQGNQALIASGFVPCAYFPAMRLHGHHRRDFVVFGRCFERIGLLKGASILKDYFHVVTSHSGWRV